MSASNTEDKEGDGPANTYDEASYGNIGQASSNNNTTNNFYNQNYNISYNNYENITQNIFIQQPFQQQMWQGAPQTHQSAQYMPYRYYQPQSEPYKSRFAHYPQDQTDLIEAGNVPGKSLDRISPHPFSRVNRQSSRFSNNSRMSSLSKGRRSLNKNRPYQTDTFFNQTMTQMVQGKDTELQPLVTKRKMPLSKNYRQMPA